MTFITAVGGIHDALAAVAGELDFPMNVKKWTSEEAHVPPACWINTPRLAPKFKDGCSWEHAWTFPLWFALPPADTANRELTRLEQVVDVASLVLQQRIHDPARPFGGRAELVGGRITDPAQEGLTALVLDLQVAIRVQHTT